MKYKDTIIEGHALDVLNDLPEGIANCLITSPPYWKARDYECPPAVWGGTNSCEHDYMPLKEKRTTDRSMRERLAEEQGKDIKSVKRKKEFTIKSEFCRKCGSWIGQLGQEPHPDMFITHLLEIFLAAKRVLKPDGTMWINLGDSYGTAKAEDTKQVETFLPRGSVEGYEKSLLCIPFTFAKLMTGTGFILRNTIIWHKPNAMPTSATDKFTVDFEYIFLFSMQKKYDFRQQFQPLSPNTTTSVNAPKKHEGYGNPIYSGFTYDAKDHPEGRNMRSVWSINTKGTEIKHFASYPPELIEAPVKAGCPVGGLVLDPFMGIGTTALVAKKFQRHYLGIEIDPKSIAMAKERFATKGNLQTMYGQNVKKLFRKKVKNG